MTLERKVFGGAAIISVASIGERLVFFLSAAILTRLLGPEPYGIMALLITFIALAGSFALGIDMSYARFFFGGSVGEKKSVERFCWRFALTTGILTAIIVAIAGRIVFSSRMDLDSALFYGAGWVVVFTVIKSLAQTRQRLKGAYGRIALAVFISGLFSVISMIVIAKIWRQDAWVLMAGALIVPVLTTLIMGIIPISEIRKPSKLLFHQKWDIVKLGLAGSVTAPMFWVISSSDRWFISLFNEHQSVGIYSFAYTIATVGILINNVLLMSWIPEAVRLHEKAPGTSAASLGRLCTRLISILMIVWLAIIASGGDLLRLIADPRFHSGTIYIPWISAGIFFYGMASLANTGLLLNKSMNPAAFWWSMGAVMNVAMNLVCVKYWGPIAAAVAQFASYALIAIGVMQASQRRFALDIHWRTLIMTALLAIGAGVPMSYPWTDNILLSLGLKFPLGVITAIFIMYIAAPDWVNRSIKMICPDGRQCSKP